MSSDDPPYSSAPISANVLPASSLTRSANPPEPDARVTVSRTRSVIGAFAGPSVRYSPGPRTAFAKTDCPEPRLSISSLASSVDRVEFVTSTV